MSSIDDLGSAAGLSEQDRELLALLLAEEGVELAPSKAIPRRAAELSGEAPLSWSQERLWVIDRMAPGTSTLDIPVSVRLLGRLDRGVLARCFAEIARRHESLRTRFIARGGVPRQVIDPPLSPSDSKRAVAQPLIDLAGLAAERWDVELHRLAAEDTRRSFDLARGPLFSTVLIRRSPDEHALLLNIHHIVTDGWSMGVLIGELSALYPRIAAATAAGAPGTFEPLPELPVQYADFAVWQRERLGVDEGFAEQLAYWRQLLAAVPPLELPTDRPRPAVQTFRGGSEVRVLPAHLAAGLAELARSLSATPYMVLLAVFSLVLGRHAGQEDFAIGSPIAGRGRPELEGLIGFFLNSLALRADLSGNPTFRALVGRTRDTALSAFANQDVPFERLLSELDVERDLSRTPIFQVLLNMLNLPRAEARFEGLAIEPISVPEAESKFDLTVYASESPEGLALRLVYNADLFRPERMRELLAQLDGALVQALAAPDRPISQIRLRTAAADAVLPDPKTPLDASWRGSVADLFLAQAARRPERLAVVDRTGSWTYGELAEASARIAARLNHTGEGSPGLARGDRVAIWAHRSAPLPAAVLGALRAGGAFAMLDPAYPAERIIAMLDLAQPRAFVRLAAAGPLPAEVDQWLARAGAIRIDLPAGGAIAVLAALPTAPFAGPAIEIGPHDRALVAFTSGSTGAPKGIVGRHGPLSHFLPWQCAEFALGEGDVFSLLSGLAHDPLQRDLFTPLCIGAKIAVPDPVDITTPGRLAAWMAERRVSVAHLTPAMGQLIAESAELAASRGAPVAIPSLRRALLVGDALTRLDVARLERIAPNLTCINLYGSTETQRAVAYHVVERSSAGEISSASSLLRVPSAAASRSRADEPSPGTQREVLPLGRGMKDVQLLVLDAEGRPAGFGEVGEIAVRSPHLAAGYLGDAELTRRRFVPAPNAAASGDPTDRMYRTGDLGRYSLNGEVEFVARADAQVKIRGFRIEPAEIEAALARHPGVREAVVVALYAENGAGDTKRLVAYFVVPPGAPEPAAEELGEFLRARLPEYMVPSLWMALDRLPLTPNGKIDRRALPAPRAASTAAAEYVAPKTETERTIAEVWREVLNLDRVGRHDKFFALGGHSLLLVRAHGRLAERLGREIAVIDLFRHPDVASLGRFLDGGSESEVAEVEARAGAIEAGKDRRRMRLERRQGAGAGGSAGGDE
ncbi:MAG TPA: condensation domain-containing protein [Thermoanaerobaculia bacterium]|jgi:non-ribosomal peptide synthetase component F|nr:condensation domain-containing protein [Thermoanaerobaculia bacterium]